MVSSSCLGIAGELFQLSGNVGGETSDIPRLAVRVILLLIIVFFCFHWIVLAHYAVDIPYWDDWEPYRRSQAGSFALSSLFRPDTDSLYPVGRFLDAMNLRLFAGDNVIYQILSFGAVMGGLLALQYALLKRYAPTAMALGAAVLSLIFMLQGGTYWGQQSVAYQQALPLLALFGALWVAVASRVRFNAKAALIGLLASLGGFSHISGAFSAAVVTLLAMAFWWRVGPGQRHEYSASALGFGSGAALSVPAQLWVIIVFQHGHVHRPDTPWSTPLDWEFWAYIVGKIGRSLGFDATASGFAFLISLVIAIVAILLALLFVWELVAQKSDRTDDQFAFVYCAICLSVFVYLGLVASGRTNLGSGDLERTVLQFFQFGQRRFHYFWVTALIPWIVLAAMHFTKRLYGAEWQTAAAIMASLIVLAIFSVNARTIFGQIQYYRSMAESKEEGIKCLAEKIQSGPPYICETLYPTDIASGLKGAEGAGAKFMTYLPGFLVRGPEAGPSL
jgi:hypothetical protein